MTVSKKVAMDQLEKLLDYYDYSYKELSDSQKPNADRVLRGLMKGRFEVTDKNTVIQNLKFPLGDNGDIKSLEYRAMKAVDKQEMDEYGAEQHNKKAQSLMGVICGKGLSVIEELEGPDLSFMENLGILFLGL